MLQRAKGADTPMVRAGRARVQVPPSPPISVPRAPLTLHTFRDRKIV